MKPSPSSSLPLAPQPAAAKASTERSPARLSFKATKKDFKLISKITARAVTMAREFNDEYDFMTASMDVNACHSSGCPLRLAALLAADDFTFAHDVFGIRRHINRETGQLENCFLPRLTA